jgi:hypothetical protein
VRYKYVTEAGKVPASLLLGLIALLTGCGVQVPSSPVGNGDTLSCPDFENNVYTVLTTPIGGKTCSDVGCHFINYATGAGGTTGGGFKVDPTTPVNAGSTDMVKNYIAAKGFSDLNSPANSRLLLKPLGAVGHGGGVIFTSTSDINYLIVLAWISNRIQGPSTCP